MESFIKEYLVSLNLKVNNSQFNEFTGKLKQLDSMTENITFKTAKGVASATGIVVGFLASVTGGVAAFLDGLAQSDIETEKFATRMWMTKEAARQLEIVLNAMGEDLGSLEDIAANDELRNYFFRLKKESNELLPPAELQNKLRGIREIRFEFMRLRQIVSYTAQWVGYYLMQYLEKPLNNTKLTLSDINDFLKDNMQEAAKKFAKVLAVIVEMAMSLVNIFVKLGYKSREFWDNLSNEQKAGAKISSFLVLGAALFKLVKLTSPIGKFVAVVGALFFLISEYQRYLGGASTKFDKFFDSIYNVFGDKELGIAFTEMLKEVFNLINESAEAWAEFDDTVQSLTGFTTLELVLRTIKDQLVIILDTITLLSKIFGWVNNAMTEGSKNWKDFWDTGDLRFLFSDMDHDTKESKDKKDKPGRFLSNMPVYDPARNARTSMSRKNELNQNVTDNKKIVNGGFNPVYNIYGSDAKKTSQEADKFNRMLMIKAFS